MTPHLRDVADGAVLVEYPGASDEEANRRAVALARSLTSRAPAGFRDAVPGARSVLVVFDARRLLREQLASAASVARGETSESGRVVEIPVVYDGPDLADVARVAGMTPEEVARRHAAGEYTVAFIGFAPGFPYLTGLPRELESPRLATPRTRVPAGSVGIGGRYTGIYPEETPGGWRLIGRASVRLFDARHDPPARVLPGDRVRFRPVPRDALERLALDPPGEPMDVGSTAAVFRIAAPGVLTSVQGGPRHGWSMYGVPPGGAMDMESLARANALVGNPPSAPGLEMTLVGADLEFVADAEVAVCAGSFELVSAVRAGEVLRGGPLRGSARAYLCVAGGFAQTARPSRRLVAGDVVFRAAPGARESDVIPPPVPAATDTAIRVLPGPQRDRFDVASFLANPYRVSASSDRRGIRLEGPAVVNRESPEIPPEGTVLGAIQVPGDGHPIILGPDRPVTGGYAKIATVVEADFARVARAVPGTVLRFEEVSCPWT